MRTKNSAKFRKRTLSFLVRVVIVNDNCTTDNRISHESSPRVRFIENIADVPIKRSGITTGNHGGMDWCDTVRTRHDSSVELYAYAKVLDVVKARRISPACSAYVCRRVFQVM